MKRIPERMARGARQLLGWYVSPAGILSGLTIIAVLLLSLLDETRAAVVVIVIWLGLLLPYKLQRERADRVEHSLRLSKQLKRTREDLSTELAAVRSVLSEELAAVRSVLSEELAAVRSVQMEEVAAVRSDLSMTPTIDDIADWQERLDQRVAAVQAKLKLFDQFSEAMRLQREANQALHDEYASVRRYLDDEIPSMRRETAALRTDGSTEIASLKEQLGSANREIRALDRTLRSPGEGSPDRE